jgi:threonylcarbamoyladenosine tRNA methylthiotransferase MtaB
MVTFHLVNFGCRASQADGAALKQQLLQAGFSESPSPQQSELAVINTCTVTATADAEARQFIRRLHRMNPRCRIIVTGCYAQRSADEIARLQGVRWVVGNSHKHTLAELVRRDFELAGKSPLNEETRSAGQAPSAAADTGFGQVGSSGDQEASGSPLLPTSFAGILVGEITDEFHFAPVFPDDRTRPTLKIQDGCNARCSFCVIPSVRGRSRSLAPDTVVEQVRILCNKGYKEVVLSGINLGSYGKDLGRSIGFLGLLERLLAETTIPCLRISSIEPMDVGSRLIDLVAQEPRMARHFHVPLQSGCDRILRLMNRRYRARQYAERMQAIQESISGCGIGGDVMVGFPGETDQDHAASAQFIASLPYTYVHVFPYSVRPGTPAAGFSGQVNGRVAHQRGQEIRSIVGAKRHAFLTAQIGRSLTAITLDEMAESARVALSSNYLKVLLPGCEIAPNTLLNVSVERTHGGLLYGRPAR